VNDCSFSESLASSRCINMTTRGGWGVS
jgi:hypothetical protein